MSSVDKRKTANLGKTNTTKRETGFYQTIWMMECVVETAYFSTGRKQSRSGSRLTADNDDDWDFYGNK